MKIQDDAEKFLHHVDEVKEAAWRIYELGESCALYFGNIHEKWSIPVSQRDYIETEIKKRDIGFPKFTWADGLLVEVVIMNPYG